MIILGVGTDIVECLRIAQMIERHGERFLHRVFTDQEIEYCQRRHAATQHFAGRWVAKEAILKSLGSGRLQGVNWRDMDVRNDKTGQPNVAFRGGLRDVVEQKTIHDIKISISHCRSHATAVAIALGESVDDTVEF